MEHSKTGITLATSAATRSRARTICIITSSSSVASCRDSTVRTVLTVRNTHRTWGLTYAEYIPTRMSTFSTWARNRIISQDEWYKFCKPSFLLSDHPQTKLQEVSKQLWYQSNKRSLIDPWFYQYALFILRSRLYHMYWYVSRYLLLYIYFRLAIFACLRCNWDRQYRLNLKIIFDVFWRRIFEKLLICKMHYIIYLFLQYIWWYM